jgi:hypothetical protein
MRKRILVITAAILISGVAHADPATHTFQITSAQTGQGDCLGGRCAANCKLEGVVTNVSPRAAQSASLMFEYPHPGTENLAITSFDIPDLQPGAAASGVQWIYGLKCKEIDVCFVSAECENSSCGYAAVRIPQTAIPGLAAMKVDIDPKASPRRNTLAKPSCQGRKSNFGRP